MFSYRIKQLRSGAVMVTMLIFLTVVTLLVVGFQEIGILENKMGHNYLLKVAAMHIAEQNLHQQEQLLVKSNGAKGGKLISQDKCRLFYRVTSVGEYSGAEAKLEATYTLRRASCKDDSVRLGQLSWRV